MIRLTSALGMGVLCTLALIPPAAAQGPQNLPNPLLNAKPGEVRVMATAAFRLPDAFVAEAEKAAGAKILIRYGSARGNLKDEILGGQAFDLALLLPDVNEQLFQAGKVKAETRDIASIPIAFGLRGQGSVDVSTPAGVKAAMLGAASVKYAPTGAALLTVKKVIADLGLEGKIKDNSTTREEVVLGPGQYEMNVYPLSEIIPNTRLKNLGPVIKELQVPSIIQAVVSPGTPNEKAVQALITFLQGPSADSTLKALGMDKAVKNGAIKR